MKNEAVELTLIVLLIVLFWGDPDIHDAIIGALNAKQD